MGTGFPFVAASKCVTGLPPRTNTVRGAFFCSLNVCAGIRAGAASGRMRKIEPRARDEDWCFRTLGFRNIFSGATAISYASGRIRRRYTAYHPTVPLKINSLPPILAGAKLTGDNFRYPWQVHVYQDAAKVSGPLPAACNCAATARLPHSLRSCFEGLHGTECSTAPRKASSPTSRPAGQDSHADSRGH